MVVFTGSCSVRQVIFALSLIFWILSPWFGKEKSSRPCSTVAVLTGPANNVEREHLFPKVPAGRHRSRWSFYLPSHGCYVVRAISPLRRSWRKPQRIVNTHNKMLPECSSTEPAVFICRLLFSNPRDRKIKKQLERWRSITRTNHLTLELYFHGISVKQPWRQILVPCLLAVCS